MAGFFEHTLPSKLACAGDFVFTDRIDQDNYGHSGISVRSNCSARRCCLVWGGSNVERFLGKREGRGVRGMVHIWTPPTLADPVLVRVEATDKLHGGTQRQERSLRPSRWAPGDSLTDRARLGNARTAGLHDRRHHPALTRTLRADKQAAGMHAPLALTAIRPEDRTHLTHHGQRWRRIGIAGGLPDNLEPVHLITGDSRAAASVWRPNFGHGALVTTHYYALLTCRRSPGPPSAPWRSAMGRNCPMLPGWLPASRPRFS
jgi:hypothetical protein